MIDVSPFQFKQNSFRKLVFSVREKEFSTAREMQQSQLSAVTPCGDISFFLRDMTIFDSSYMKLHGTPDQFFRALPRIKEGTRHSAFSYMKHPISRFATAGSYTFA